MITGRKKWQYFSRQQDESDREYVRAFKDEFIDLVAKAAQYQKEQTTEYQSKYDVQKLVKHQDLLLKIKKQLNNFCCLLELLMQTDTSMTRMAARYQLAQLGL